MESGRSPYRKHLFVCVNKRDPGVTCCAHGGGEAIREKLKAFVKANGLKGKVRVSSSGCMDLCAKGPNVMVYPDHRWYSHVTLEDVETIIQEQLAPLVQDGIASPRHDGNKALPIEAFLFDLGNVLVQFDHRFAAQRIAAHTTVSPEELYRLFFESPLIVDHDCGRISTPEFYQALKHQIGLDIPYEEFLSVWNGIFSENKEMSALVGTLSRRFPCFLISNTNRPHFEFLRETVPVLNTFNGWVLSYEVGVLKPHPEIYRRALELAHAPAERIFYIDDRQDLVAAARELGFQVHRFEGAGPLAADLKKRGVHG